VKYLASPSTGVPHRYVFELRYDQGDLYWDRAGRITRKLAAQEGWALQGIDTNGCHLRKDDDNLEYNFSAISLSLAQTQNQDVSSLMHPSEFAALGDMFSETVMDVLELESFSRVGFRSWTLFPTETLDDASDRIARSSAFALNQPVRELGSLSSVSFGVVVARKKYMVRIAVAPFEQHIAVAPSLIAAAKIKARESWTDQRKLRIQQLKAKKRIESYPQQGIMIDLDAYIEEPPFRRSLSCRDFVVDVVRDFELIRDTVLREVE
jgi:hypothetical protein